MTIDKFIEKHGGYWSEHPGYPVVDWAYEVANGDTRKGYWEWAYASAEAEGDEE